MAILSNGKFYGFLCSVKETGQKLANGVKEYMEDFVSGFAGHGWKLWEYVKGKWKLEIDTIVVRETMLVFEMLISKVRAIIGAQAITQGHGKVKSVRVSDDGTEFLIELEGEDMSIVAHDFVRCQTFAGDKTKLYHVEVSSVDVATRTLHVPLTEFDQDEAGNILNPPVAGDELVQFGNSQNKSRQSAIYLHADETGQPAIDVMFDIDSKNWEGKVKVRVGGDIPDSGGLKGFYCENGMIKGVNSDGHVVYCIYPDGTAEFGDGSARFSTDRSGHIAGGAISWQWNEVKQKYVCTMKDVVLTWENLSDEVKENLKGEPGKDANLLPWIEDWNGTKVTINGESMVSPKAYFGTVSSGQLYTGVLIGNEVHEIGKAGIYGIKDKEIVFKLNSEGENTIGGWTIEKDGLSCKSANANIRIDLQECDYLHLNSGDALLEIGSSLFSKACIKLNPVSGVAINPGILVEKTVLSTCIIRGYGGMQIEQDNDFTPWDVPGCLLAMTIKIINNTIQGQNIWNGPITSGNVESPSVGRYKFIHNLGHDIYVPMAIASNGNVVSVIEKTSSYFTLQVTNINGTNVYSDLYVSMFGKNNFKMGS